MQYPGITDKEEEEGYLSNKGKVRCRQKYDKTPGPVKYISISEYLKENEKQNKQNF